MILQKALRRLGERIDRRYLDKVGATAVPGSLHQLLLVCYHPYHGKKPVQINDVTVKPGDIVGELHLSNQRITEIGSQSERGMQWQLLEMLRAEFAALASACAAGDVPAAIQGFYGVNVLPAGARRLGFTLIPLPPGWERWWLGFWESCLRLIYYSFRGRKKPSLGKTMDPYEIWITRETLWRTYGQSTGTKDPK